MTGIQHVALHVSNVETSIRFYQDVLKWQLIPRPAFDFPGAWFRIGERAELHLIGGRTQPICSGSRSNHFAIYHPEPASMMQLAQDKGIPYEGIKVRPDGVIQLFIFDPDGHCIEFNNAP